MLTNSPFFASYAVDDLTAAEEFYTQKLGLAINDIGPGLLGLRAGNGYSVLIYAKPGYEPAGHTVLNFPVDDIDAAVDELTSSGITFEQYDEGPLEDEREGHRRARPEAGLVPRPGRQHPVRHPVAAR